MSEGIENLNKQIASFIILSAALAVPVSTSAYSGNNNNLLADASLLTGPHQGISKEVMLFYGAPGMPGPIDVKPLPGPAPIISLYAAPQVPIDIKPIQGPPPAISLYAAPQRPIDIKQPHFFPIHEIIPEKMPEIPKTNINESALNINNVNPANIQQNLTKNSDIGASAKANINNTNVNLNANMRTDGFVNTEYGSVKIVEPYAHFVFK